MRLVAWCVGGEKVPPLPIMVCTVVGTDKIMELVIVN